MEKVKLSCLEITKNRISRLREKHNILSNKRHHAEALFIEGAMLHMELLYNDLLEHSFCSDLAKKEK